MNFSFYIAKRYLISKKSHNAINIISAISVGGMAAVAMVLIVLLSAFNGLESTLKSLLNSFNPDLQITIAEGKKFVPDSSIITKLNRIEGIYDFAEVVEENALFEYDEKQYFARLKGVSNNFTNTTGIDSMMVDGEFQLQIKNEPHAVIGQGVAHFLSVNLNFFNPIVIYVPKHVGNSPIINPAQYIKRKYIHPSGIFSIQNDIDIKYIIVPIDFARDLLDYKNEVTALEIKVKDGFDTKDVKSKITDFLGGKYVIKNRYEQNEVFYKIMKSEKFAIYFILTFILIVASFNIIGSLTMLIIEKKEDLLTLQGLGASKSLIKKIFFLEGMMISVVGAIAGLLIGLLICYLQQEFGLVKLSGSGSFIIDAYPVDIQLSDTFLVLAIVLFIGTFTAWIPARYITKKHIDIFE